MPFEFLSDEQVARYGRFPDEPSPAELEQFFRLDRAALDALATKRRPARSLSLPSSLTSTQSAWLAMASVPRPPTSTRGRSAS